MTRISTSYGTPALRALPAPGRRTRISKIAAKLPVEADVASNRPVEEVVFEANGGVDQKGKQRGFLVNELKEETLVERPRNGRNLNADLDHDQFWQRFSTPFMAQMIGQTGDRAHRSRQGYRQIAVKPQTPELSRAV